MTFINEYIPEKDIEKYNLKNIDSHFHPSINADDWTVDRERDMYLRQQSSGREEYAHESWWTFYWHGRLFSLQLDIVSAGGKPGGPGWSHYKLRRIALFEKDESSSFIEDHFTQITSDLEKALSAYKGGGVFSTRTSSTTTLDIDLI